MSGAECSNRLNCSTSSDEDAEDLVKITEDIVFLQLAKLRKKIYKHISQNVVEERNFKISRDEISQILHSNQSRVIRALTVSMSSAPSMVSLAPSTYTWASRLHQQHSEHTLDERDISHEAVIAGEDESGVSSNDNNEPEIPLVNASSKDSETLQNVEQAAESVVVVMEREHEQAPDATLVNQDIPNASLELPKSDNPWKAEKLSAEDLEQEEGRIKKLLKDVRALLNKITPTTKDALIDDFLGFDASRTREQLTAVINIIYDKAVNEPKFCPLYVELCKKQVEKELSKKVFRFRDGLLNRIQNAFVTKIQEQEEEREKMMTAIAEETDAKKKTQLESELQESENKFRRRKFGNILFMGQLFWQQFLSTRMVLWCLHDLLKHTHSVDNKLPNPPYDEEALHCALQLIEGIGPKLEKANEKEFNGKMYLEQTIDHLLKIAPQCSNKIRFMILNLAELLRNGWVPRKVVDSVPKTLEEILADVWKEQLENQAKNDQVWPEDEAVAEKPEVEILPKEPEVEEVLPEVVSNTVSMETIVDSEPKLPENEVCDEEMRVFDSDLEEDEHEEAETCVGTLQKWDTDARLHSLSTVAADDDEELTNLDLQSDDPSNNSNRDASTPSEMIENNVESNHVATTPQSESTIEEVVSPECSWDESRLASSVEVQAGALNVAAGDFTPTYSHGVVDDQTNHSTDNEVEPFVPPTTDGSDIAPNERDIINDGEIYFAEELLPRTRFDASGMVKILRFNGPDDFYIADLDYQPKRAALREKITAWARCNMEKPGVVIYKDLTDLHYGLPVLMYSVEDKLYERAIVTKYSPDNEVVDVFLVDAGTEAFGVPLENIVQMSLEHSLIEPLSIHCMLRMPRQYDCSSEVLEEMKNGLLGEIDEFSAEKLEQESEGTNGKLVVQLNIRVPGQDEFVDLVPSIVWYLEDCAKDALEAQNLAGDGDLTGVGHYATSEQQLTMHGQNGEAAPQNRTTSADEW